MLPWLPPYPVQFPPASHALDQPSGLLAAGGTLEPEWLLAAYRQGIFPWYSDGQPILWWSPAPRTALFPEELHVSRSLAKRVRNGGFEVTFNRAFAAVVAACSAPRPGQDGTWITADMQTAYLTLHQLGYARSVEVWDSNTLVGGLYGVALGPVFFGESMFSHRRDTSKIALVHLVQAMRHNGGKLIDCQMHTPHLARLGARNIARADFIGYLDTYLAVSESPKNQQPLPCWPLPSVRPI